MKNQYLLFVFALLSITLKAQTKKDSPAMEFEWIKEKDTTLIGKAFNAKSGAVIITLEEKTYYIHKLDSWPAKKEGKLLKVKGRLAMRKAEPQKKGEPIVQSDIGNALYLVNATYGVIKK